MAGEGLGAGEGRRDFRGRRARFAEQALYKLLAKGLLSNPEGNIGARWKEATYGSPAAHCQADCQMETANRQLLAEGP